MCIFKFDFLLFNCSFQCLYSRIFKIYVSSTICMIENENIHLDIDMIIKNIKLKSILIYSL